MSSAGRAARQEVPGSTNCSRQSGQRRDVPGRLPGTPNASVGSLPVPTDRAAGCRTALVLAPVTCPGRGLPDPLLFEAVQCCIVHSTQCVQYVCTTASLYTMCSICMHHRFYAVAFDKDRYATSGPLTEEIGRPLLCYVMVAGLV